MKKTMEDGITPTALNDNHLPRKCAGESHHFCNLLLPNRFPFQILSPRPSDDFFSHRRSQQQSFQETEQTWEVSFISCVTAASHRTSATTSCAGQEWCS